MAAMTSPRPHQARPGACRAAAWALAYAALGWRVYPVERGGKRPLYTGWLSDATTEQGLIDRWWPRDEGAPNVGVVAGDRFDVFDIEAEHVAAFRDTALARGLPTTPTARSGGGDSTFMSPRWAWARGVWPSTASTSVS